MDRARDAEFQEQATNVAGESLGGRRVVHRQRLGVDAAIPLKQFPDENRDRVLIPSVDDRRCPFVGCGLSLEATVPEEERDGFRGDRSIDPTRTDR